jgi:hypothetical protein
MSSPKPKPYVDPMCNTKEAVDFVKRIKAESQLVADQIDVPLENIVGLAAEETQYGEGRFAKRYNNYFSMRSPAPFETGFVPALEDPKVKVATYSSLHKCGESFVERWGDTVRGIKDPIEFAKALKKAHFNTGDSKTGGRDNFVNYLVGIIAAVKVRLAC